MKPLSSKSKLTRAILRDDWLCPKCDTKLNPPMRYSMTNYEVRSPDFGEAKVMVVPRRCPECKD